MPVFVYSGRTSDGVKIQATIEAASRYEATAALRERGVTVVSLAEAGAAERGAAKTSAAPAPRRGRIKLAGRVSLSDRAIFCRQLAVSVGAGVPLREALESLAEDMDHPAFRAVLNEVVANLHQGKTFSEALSRHVRVFTPLFVALIRTAEESGTMPRTLEDLARTLERTDRLVRKIRSITAYPLFVFVFFVLVCLIMTVFVVPQFQQAFAGFGAELPWLTRAIFRLNRFLLDYLLWIVLALFAASGGLIVYARTPFGRVRLDEWTLKVPLIGGCVRKLALARFCRNLSMMLFGGVSVTTAIEIASATCGNLAIERALRAACERIVSGMNVSGSLAQDPEFPRLIVRMVSVGESSGRLPEVLDKVSEVYEEQVEGAIMTATTLFEPVAIVLFGAVILVLVLAIYVPIFSVASRIR